MNNNVKYCIEVHCSFHNSDDNGLFIVWVRIILLETIIHTYNSRCSTRNVVRQMERAEGPLDSWPARSL